MINLTLNRQDFAIEIFKPKIIQHFDGLDPEEEKYVIEVCEVTTV